MGILKREGTSWLGVIRLEKVKDVVRQAHRGKAVGDDGIPNEFLKDGGKVVAVWTEILFNVVRDEYVPMCKEWGTQCYVRMGDREDLNNYRGITLQTG